MERDELMARASMLHERINQMMVSDDLFDLEVLHESAFSFLETIYKENADRIRFGDAFGCLEQSFPPPQIRDVF